MGNTMSKILIIDDEEDLVALLKDTLERRGHLVLTAYDGNNGVEKAFAQPELIILDIMMPGMNGYEVCRRIRDVVMCPIIFLSAKQTETDRIRSFALGGDDYITCLLYTSDAADEEDSVDLGGRRIIKKKT